MRARHNGGVEVVYRVRLTAPGFLAIGLFPSESRGMRLEVYRGRPVQYVMHSASKKTAPFAGREQGW